MQVPKWNLYKELSSTYGTSKATQFPFRSTSNMKHFHIKYKGITWANGSVCFVGSEIKPRKKSIQKVLHLNSTISQLKYDPTSSALKINERRTIKKLNLSIWSLLPHLAFR